jgi:hypothetical protein
MKSLIRMVCLAVLFTTVGQVQAGILANYPSLFATLNGNSQTNLFPGFGIVQEDGAVIETSRMRMVESQNSFSAFGITRNSLGDYWTSTGNTLLQFDPVTGNVLRSLSKPFVFTEPFLNLVFDSSDRLIGWSNNNGFLYEISLGANSYTETQLVFVGLHAGGLTEMAFASDGTLYGIDNRNKRLITIDLTTGARNTVAQFGFGDYIGLAFAPDETLFTTNSLGRQLIQLDRQGNELSRVAYLADTPILGLEFANVPEPSSLTIWGVGVLGMGLFVRRKNRNRVAEPCP